ncbi:MAG: DUF1080 domain-containing protein [Gemmatimonadetes bacterium]|nr:DUF1080 domain-containing protein [Gemmatimonadota bacterium]
MKMTSVLILLCLATVAEAPGQRRARGLPACSEKRTVPCAGARHSEPQALLDGWFRLFDGRSFDGWRIAEDANAFRIENGAIVANGLRSHLFYDGPLMDRDFKNFELQAEVMTRPGANSAIYVHTHYMEGAWPNILPSGYEIQINNTAANPGRTASVFTFADILEPPAKDDVWFVMNIRVTGRRVQVRIDDRLVNDYTEPADKRTRLTGGTFALQAHEVGEITHFRNIVVRPLPD